MNSRRDSLNKVTVDNVAHAGLWLDRYLPEQPENKANQQRPNNALVGKHPVKHDECTSDNPLTKHFCRGSQIARKEPVLKLYQQFFARWLNALKEIPDICLLKAEVKGRMVVGLGAESVLENSIALQRTYGMPYIPGSALKGLASSFAHQRLGQGAANADTPNDWAKGGKFHRELFGTTELSGCVSFYDALYMPDTAETGGPLHPDVITVHHPEYYQGKKKPNPNGDQDQSMPPADWDSPTIIQFLSATGHYLVALSGVEGWRDTARTLLANGLTHIGIGAKTSSGYGRMELKSLNEAEIVKLLNQGV
ncbi:type III-B CRISPR module RAMP protein Cmr6 [Herpetosiphon geysericola]|uniref:type III-B CRISPR module RAMP protein Cmr6 n=1 Tax=Herpetosiphon geysericola TaxID=70996 RepID=UPI0006C90B4F|nr:type III-B CRISPR module RAMP protein Cmr6 [Herpetosiphon geysericola]